VLAQIRNEFGPGKTAEMTYYHTTRGARVFAAGTINFGGAADNPVVSRLLANLWNWLKVPERGGHTTQAAQQTHTQR
jgi:hypothetical protein